MSEELWDIREHVIPASHIRGFSRGARNEQTGHLRLAVKQYVPRKLSEPKVGDVTLIMAHGVGSSKESYEPFYDELLTRNIPIRAVWAMDAAHHSASYLLNEDRIGDDPHWLDSSRDMMQMVNHFQEQMPPPLIALGQSWGCVTIAGVSFMHPRLFTSMVFLEPTFGTNPMIRTKDRAKRRPDRLHRGVAMAKRQDTWPSLAAARTRLRASPYYAAFDARVFERVMKNDFRPASAEGCAKVGSADAVTLVTPKAMEVATMMRPDPPFDGYPEESDLRNRPDDIIDTRIVQGFYRGEVVKIYEDLPCVLPSTLLVWASKSLAGTDYARDITNRIGIGYGGNGGVAAGRVKSVDIPDIGHPLPLEKPGVVAEAVAEWLQNEIVTWNISQQNPRPPFSAALHAGITERVAKL